MRGGSTGTQWPLSRAATHRSVAIPSFRSGTAAETATIAFLCVLITYFGVNLLLGGMHSYV